MSFLKDKPVISNQHGALVMAFVPFLYAVFSSSFIYQQIFFGLAWLFLYFCSYPFLALFNKKQTARNQKWAIIYLIISLIFAFPVLSYEPAILQFSIPILPLVLIQIYYTKQKDERNLNNDFAAILVFGIIGMASSYLVTKEYNWAILLHPTLFFIATTFYIKSVARERRNPIYLKLSIYIHLILALIYVFLGFYFISFSYFIVLGRAIIIPNKKLNVKQVGMIEFPFVSLFFISLLMT